ncbi:MAG: hypothetical protein NC319_04770 [Butyricicoccus sp.]|nr:hypothetical protein [Butyricicoccus sp.]
MILVRNMKLPIDGDERELRAMAAAALKIPEREIRSLKIVKKSLDARKKNGIRWLYSVAVETAGEQRLLRRAGNRNCELYKPFAYDIPRVSSDTRPVIAGFGPAGIFAALVLAEAGARPIVLERGCALEERRERVESFWSGGELCPDANVQFGEGGAGMFSDGKLGTGTHDVRIAWVLEQFRRFGAPESVCYDAHPHVGTDVLADVVKNIREHILALGGEVRTRSKLSGLRIESGALAAVTVEGADIAYELPCRDLILAIGHSARDTFEMLHALGVPMEQKPFSMGVRIEHAQSEVGESQYGEAYTRLPPAEYKLNCRLPDGSSAYTFCMCPGGYVVAAASESGGVVTNGMSLSGRSGENANSALLVALTPEDFPGNGALAGMYWQREIERRAFELGGGDYRAPAQTVGDFLAGRASAGPCGVEPTYRPGVKWTDIRRVLPERVCDTIAAAIPELARRMRCFDMPGAVMTAPETRSSSPVRILRGTDLRSSFGGFYPSGEGAGYAGGITSAAVDGMKCAERVIETLK